jgi:hypothetical protein
MSSVYTQGMDLQAKRLSEPERSCLRNAPFSIERDALGTQFVDF